MSELGPVLVVGGTGMLGAQVVSELLTRGKQVHALVRPGSDATRLEASGVTIARGDMMEPDSLLRAMDGIDTVITSAAGYTRHREGDSPVIDAVGNINLVDAASRSGIRRFVLTSILTCDQTPDVPHFWHKKLTEDRLEELAVPFVALRPGAFLDTLTRFGGDPFSKGQLTWFGSPSIPLTFVLTADLAGYLAAAVDATGVDGQRIDIGWDRPVSMREIADVAARLLRTPVTVLGPTTPMAGDLGAMMDWFQTGRYVADTTRQREVFGPLPTAEDAVARLLTSLGHVV